MKICFNKVPMILKGHFKKLANLVMECTGNSKNDIILGLTFISGEGMQMLNREKRGVDKVTDVLSFPLLDIHEGEKVAEFESERLPINMLPLGDIVICKAKAHAQAKEYNHTYKREVSFLFVHGLLHLLGYDHMEKEEETRMMNLTENILLNVGLGRKDD